MMLDKNGIRLMVSNFVCPLCSVNFIPLFELKIKPEGVTVVARKYTIYLLSKHVL